MNAQTCGFPTGPDSKAPAKPWWAALLSLFLAASLPWAADARAGGLDLTTTAKLLAGIDPGSQDPAVMSVTSGESWQQHRKAARAGDRQLKTRLAKIDAWQAKVLAQVHRANLVYPFSGPDFINAYALFPDADTYVFFSLEAPGDVPKLDAMSPEQQAGLFQDLRSALNDLVALNFFITPNMKENLQTGSLQGNVPVLLAMMGLLDLHVDAVENYDPWPERTRVYVHATEPAAGESLAKSAPPVRHPDLLERGVRISFTNPRNGHHQSLIYLAVDVSDHELHFYPGFVAWLQTFDHPAVLLKSASYLLHGEHFRALRKELLEKADVIVEDDTGLPYKMIKDKGFEITLFGQYERPVKLFEGRYQGDLEAAYALSGNSEPLPFPFGYNWRKDGKSGLLLAQRATSQ
jgi:hypothetical protein